MVLRHTYIKNKKKTERGEEKRRERREKKHKIELCLYLWLPNQVNSDEKERTQKFPYSLFSLPDSHYDSVYLLPVKHTERMVEQRIEEKKRDHWQFLIVVVVVVVIRLYVCAYSFVWRLLLRFDSIMARRSIKFNNFSLSLPFLLSLYWIWSLW